MNFKSTDLGFEIEFLDYLIFFGDKKSTLVHLKRQYPSFSFVRIKQIHSDIVVQASQAQDDLLLSADAHWTLSKGLGLLISTADCIPLFLVDPLTEKIAGVHAGWRGLSQKIAIKTLIKMNLSDYSQVRAYIGPHIKKESFEIDQNVLESIISSLDLADLKRSANSEAQKSFKHLYDYDESSNKYFLDLEAVQRLQLIECGLKESHIQSLDMNTFKNEKFNSFRRDREQSGRQLSFIIKKDNV